MGDIPSAHGRFTVYKGFRYFEDYYEDYDVSKIIHYAVKISTREQIELDFSSYCHMESSHFRLFVDFNFPTRRAFETKCAIQPEDMERLRRLVDEFNVTSDNFEVMLKLNRP